MQYIGTASTSFNIRLTNYISDVVDPHIIATCHPLVHNSYPIYSKKRRKLLDRYTRVFVP